MRYQWYAASVPVVGLAVLAISHLLCPGVWTSTQLEITGVVLALALISRRLPLKISPQASASLTGAPLFIGVLLLSPLQVAVAAGISALVADRWLGRKPIVALFNCGMGIWAVSSSSLVFHLLAGPVPQSLVAPSNVGAALLSGLILQSTNLGLLAGVVSLRKGISFWSTWKKTWTMDAVQEGGVLVLGYLGAALAQQALWTVALLAVPLALAHRALSHSMQEARENIRLAQELKERSMADSQRAGQALEKLSRQTQLILSSAGEGILGVDPLGNIAFANPAAGSMLGKPVERLIGRPVHQVLHNGAACETPGHEHCPLLALPTGPSLRRAEDTFVRADGSPLPVEYSAASIQPDEPLGAVITFQDTTQRIQLQQQLLQAQKMESIGRLAGGVAHDFNNLLTPIVGFGRLAMMDLTPEHPARGYVGEITKAADRAAKLTHQLLAFSRRGTIETKVINLSDVIVDMDLMLRRLLGEDIELVTLPAASETCAKVDRSQIEQVLVNLAINARDAMPSGGKATIQAESVQFDEGQKLPLPELSPGRYVLLSVIDTGLGMTNDVKARLFEPFFTTKELGKGTGLGLATCYGIVKQNGGYITVESEPCKGAAFRVYFRQVAAEPDERVPTPDLDDIPKGKETVLLVEDEPLVRQLAATVLQRQGYAVLQASNGSDALWLAEEGQNKIDLLLTDLVMPQMGGRELAARFSSLYPSSRILLMSGYPSGSGSPEEIGLPLLRKPFPPSILAQRVREVLDGR